MDEIVTLIGVPAKVWAGIKLYFKAAGFVAEKQAEQIRTRSAELEQQGHSKNCAGVIAADELNLIDGDPMTVIRMSGGCQKCGI
mmetsp:Transcript_49178/g.115541  ORF Transcript_49178/g.115541 Transcript_49178/m.115541 type:complete len:84 (-) Transcript_49178:106-357(-)|eukprot:CAMPEP_0175826740 /NCGR_PEP_ID=MMETSP0107_2-20121207/11920_1 /TAXON_ID=195067 ORGANISM="Goniomonas pacifica, Strain CCMP1869" /NCGR_SAMPLE_ID=MMETSP0107_2 /ASSEMBLY_ACC=CAM_ASM_000203 /LENGTH=83 /DNA_ID=CAMNT_0017139387 /DNA_START=43 /DNA_END=294 /DNA_ORIENTATION=-